jgi:hypothetical protein
MVKFPAGSTAEFLDLANEGKRGTASPRLGAAGGNGDLRY